MPIVTMIEPDGSVWVEMIPEERLGMPYQRADNYPVSPRFAERVIPIKTSIIRYTGVQIRTPTGRTHWVYTPD